MAKGSAWRSNSGAGLIRKCDLEVVETRLRCLEGDRNLLGGTCLFSATLLASVTHPAPLLVGMRATPDAG